MKKKILFTTCLTLMLSSNAYAEGVENKYTFGSKKGQIIKSVESKKVDLMRQQNETLKNILAAQESLVEKFDTMKKSKSDDMMLQLVKELAKATKRQNQLLEQILKKTK